MLLLHDLEKSKIMFDVLQTQLIRAQLVRI